MKKEVFQSIQKGYVKVFVCGPTIQDRMHIGHARTYLFYDVLVRYMKYLGYDVKFLMNITDIDESIVKASKAKRMDLDSFIAVQEASFIADMKSLGIDTVSSFERVSHYLPEMIKQIEILLENNNAYRANGNIYFDVSSFPDFGKLSHLSSEEILLRPYEISPAKRNQVDFSLWRLGSYEEQRWESPWGKGTPGWHIQDTAVTLTKFWPQYDIHGGARELIFPHHEAEIAQAESITGKEPFVRYWVHTGIVKIAGKKMSKSEGNITYVKDLLAKYDANVIRLYLLSKNYRRDIEFEEQELRRWNNVYHDILSAFNSLSADKDDTDEFTLNTFLKYLDDNLNTGRAINFLIEQLNKAFRENSKDRATAILNASKIALDLLGIRIEVNRRNE